MNAREIDIEPVLPANWSEVQSPTLGARAFLAKNGLRVIASIDRAEDGSHWYHVSLSRKAILPSYDDMVKVKSLFIGDEREAIQVFPPRSQRVNDHPNCLHLWHRIDGPVMPDMRKYEPALRRLSI